MKTNKIIKGVAGRWKKIKVAVLTQFDRRNYEENATDEDDEYDESEGRYIVKKKPGDDSPDFEREEEFAHKKS